MTDPEFVRQWVTDNVEELARVATWYLKRRRGSLARRAITDSGGVRSAAYVAIGRLLAYPPSRRTIESCRISTLGVNAAHWWLARECRQYCNNLRQRERLYEPRYQRAWQQPEGVSAPYGRDLLHRAVAHLQTVMTGRDLAIFWAAVQGATFLSIAKQHGLTASRIDQIVRKCQVLMRETAPEIEKELDGFRTHRRRAVQQAQKEARQHVGVARFSGGD